MQGFPSRFRYADVSRCERSERRCHTPPGWAGSPSTLRGSRPDRGRGAQRPRVALPDRARRRGGGLGAGHGYLPLAGFAVALVLAARVRPARGGGRARARGTGRHEPGGSRFAVIVARCHGLRSPAVFLAQEMPRPRSPAGVAAGLAGVLGSGGWVALPLAAGRRRARGARARWRRGPRWPRRHGGPAAARAPAVAADVDRASPTAGRTAPSFARPCRPPVRARPAAPAPDRYAGAPAGAHRAEEAHACPGQRGSYRSAWRW